MMMMRRRRRLWFRSGRWRRRGGRLAMSSQPSVARAPPPSCSRSRSGGLGLSVATRARGAGPPSRRRQRRLRAAVHSRVLGAVAVGATGAAIAGAKIGALGTGRHRPGPKVLMVEVLACTRLRNGLTMVMSTLTRLPLPCSRLPGVVPGAENGGPLASRERCWHGLSVRLAQQCGVRAKRARRKNKNFT